MYVRCSLWFPFPAVGTEASFRHVLTLAIRFRIRNPTRPGTVYKEIAKLVYTERRWKKLCEVS
jgi:hypothetical protein